jgi:hypothetical protein
MTTATLTLTLPCGCKTDLYRGDVVGIPFGRLPKEVAEFIGKVEARGCVCPAIQTI